MKIKEKVGVQKSCDTLSADYVPEWEEGVVGGGGGREEDLEAPNIRGRGL